MNQNILLIANLVILVAEIVLFYIGSKRLLLPGKPYYYKILLFVVGCFILNTFSTVVTLYCGVQTTFMTISSFSIIACNLLLYSANHGAINYLFDDIIGKRTRFYATIGAFIYSALILFIAYMYSKQNIPSALILILFSIPAVPVVFWNIKHLCIKNDELGILSRIRLCDISSLVLLFAMALQLLFSIIEPFGLVLLFMFIEMIAMTIMVFASIKGADKWKI